MAFLAAIEIANNESKKYTIMSVLSSITTCPNLQEPLETVFMGLSPTKTMESYGALQFLTSDINRAGFEQIGSRVSPGDAKRRTVEVRYTPWVTEDVVQTGSRIDKCTSSRVVGDEIATYSIDPDTYSLFTDFTINKRNLEENCRSNSMWLYDTIVAMMNALERKAHDFVLSQLTTQIGTFYDKTNVTADVKTVQTLDSSGNNTQNLIEEVTYNSNRNMYGSAPFVFGHGEIYKYLKRVNAGCCLQSGLDLRDYGNQNDMTFIPDAKVEGNFGTNHFITMAPGAVQLIFFNEYDGAYPNSLETQDKVRRKVNGMFTGIPIDLKIDENCTGGTDNVNVFLQACVKAVTMPDDMFGNDANLAGQKMFNEYVITNP